RLAVTLPADLADAAASLPEQFRQQFVGGFANAGSLQGGQGGSFPLPPGVPDDVARQVTDAATAAFHQGFATAVGQTLAVTAAVLVLGFVCAIAMAPKHVEH
ncbi:MFS transporter, partial [Streptomyces sp. SID13726]|nr:MFS transporter [Streptomyces sp. SID13726]